MNGLMNWRGCKGKMKRGFRLKPEHFRNWSRPMNVLSDVTVSRNWYKTVSNLYENLNMTFFHQIVNET